MRSTTGSLRRSTVASVGLLPVGMGIMLWLLGAATPADGAEGFARAGTEHALAGPFTCAAVVDQIGGCQGAEAGLAASPVLIAGWMDYVDNFFARNKSWILSIALVIVILGFVLLYKGWK